MKEIVSILVVEMVVRAILNTVEYLRYWGRRCSGGEVEFVIKTVLKPVCFAAVGTCQ